MRERQSDFAAKFCVLAVIGSAALGLDYSSRPVFSSTEPAQLSQNARVKDLVFVTEDLASIKSPGCDGITVFNTNQEEPVHRGDWHPSPSRLAATSDFETIIGINSNSCLSGDSVKNCRFLYILRQEKPGDYTHWTSEYVGGAGFIYLGGIAIVPNDDKLLVAVGSITDNSYHPVNPPYKIAMYSLAEIKDGKVGEEKASFQFGDSIPAEILVTRDGTKAHVLTDDNDVFTLDLDTMTQTALPIKLSGGPFSSKRHPTEIHATLSTDENLLITNNWQNPAGMIVADLNSRTALTIGISNIDGHTGVAGLAINHGSYNSDMIAINLLDRVVTGRLDRHTWKFDELDRVEIPLPRADDPIFNYGQQMSNYFTDDGRGAGPVGSIAWSGDGSKLIAAMNDINASAEFRLFGVDFSGKINHLYDWTACPQPPPIIETYCNFPPCRLPNIPNDILTPNGFVPTAQPETNHAFLPTALVNYGGDGE